MTPLSKRVLCALGISATLFSGSAMAQFTTDATLNYGFRLLDLDVNDGVAPGISFSGTNTVSVSGFTSTLGQAEYTYQNRSNFDPINTSIVHGDASGAASLSGNVLRSNVQITSPGFVYGIARIDSNFTLTPKTQIIFFGHASGNAAGPTGTLDQYVYSYSSLELSGNTTPNGPVTQYDRYWESADSIDGHAPGHFDSNFEVSYVNANTTALDGHVYIFTQATSNYYPPAVPEPETYAMLLAGLGLLGFIARRRKQA